LIHRFEDLSITYYHFCKSAVIRWDVPELGKKGKIALIHFTDGYLWRAFLPIEPFDGPFKHVRVFVGGKKSFLRGHGGID